MSRADDVRAMTEGGMVNVVDLTPTPLTAAGWGPWHRISGKPGFIHYELAATTNPTASVRVQASNSKRTDTGVDLLETPDLLGSARLGGGFTVLSGFAHIRVGCPDGLAGTDVELTATFAQN